ncbi:retrovirus-related pol polyprotein from transposon TNT 1-94 [Tanacetum coccineum]
MKSYSSRGGSYYAYLFQITKISLAESISTACFTQNCSLIHTRYNKTQYELLPERKQNVEYFHVFGSLCYPTNDREDLGKMKPKADIGIFIGYSETNRFQDNDSSAEDTSILSNEDLDNLFGLMFEEYFEKRPSEVSINSAAQTTLNNQDTPSSSSIIIEDNEDHPLVS